MIDTRNQYELSAWLCERIGLIPTKMLRVIGQRSEQTGEIIGVVGYDGWNGVSCQMHSAGEGNWVTRNLLFAAFDYPFNVANCGMVLGMIPSGNEQAVKFNNHLGFKTECVIKGAHPDGSLIIMSMSRAECRYLKRNGHHGQEKRTGCTSST